VEGVSLKGQERLVDLEALSDLLLQLSGRDEHYPAYSEARTAKREQIDAQWAPRLYPLHHHAQSDAVSWLRRHEIAMMLQVTPLTPRQRRVVELFLQGYTFEEIGKHWSISKQAAHKLFLRACEAIRRSWQEHPLHGLTLTYSESTLRHYARRTRWLNRDEEAE
jgi:hypothetical protein